MQIFVGTTAYEVDSSTSVATLMHQIENKEFLPAGSFCLRAADGSILESGLLDVEEDDELTLQLAVPGGMRNKWKKKRMRRLRRKRRKMRQRAR